MPMLILHPTCRYSTISVYLVQPLPDVVTNFLELNIRQKTAAVAMEASSQLPTVLDSADRRVVAHSLPL